MHKPVANQGVPATDRENSADELPTHRTPPASPVGVDASKAHTQYANFCRLSATPEEVLLDFGLNQQPIETTPPTVTVQRVVVCWHTAKRLQHVLQETVSRFEATFGVLETDVQKRVGRSRAQN